MPNYKTHKLLYEDRIALTMRHRVTGEIVRQGKRLPKDFPLSHNVVRAYVAGGLPKAVKQLRKEQPRTPLREAIATIKMAAS